MEWPIYDETFDNLRNRHKRDFFQEKALKTKLQIEGLKAALGIENLDFKNIDEEERIKNIQIIGMVQKQLKLGNTRRSRICPLSGLFLA